jgi:hypothetical protein
MSLRSLIHLDPGRSLTAVSPDGASRSDKGVFHCFRLSPFSTKINRITKSNRSSGRVGSIVVILSIQKTNHVVAITIITVLQSFVLAKTFIFFPPSHLFNDHFRKVSVLQPPGNQQGAIDAKPRISRQR